MNKCYRCMKPLGQGEIGIHAKCKKDFWPMEDAFMLPFSLDDVKKIAEENALSRITVPGVQPKLSLHIEGNKKSDRVTIVGAMGGNYILKIPVNEYPEMPELEAISMHLTSESGIRTVPFSLIPFQSGELAYITKRIDRVGDIKFAMEDFCQLTEKLTEHKYRGSYEQVAKKIKEYAENDLLDIVRFYEIVLVSFLIGNSDMHLKNFSLLQKEIAFNLAPAYDILATKILLPQDKEELALTLNGKKSNLNSNDFQKAMEKSGLPERSIQNLFNRILNASETWPELIGQSFISKEMQNQLLELIESRKKQLLAL